MTRRQSSGSKPLAEILFFLGYSVTAKPRMKNPNPYMKEYHFHRTATPFASIGRAPLILNYRPKAGIADYKPFSNSKPARSVDLD